MNYTLLFRAHLAAQGLPIVADALYGNGQGIAGLDRLGLHARSLTIEHPVTHAVMQFEAPYPEDFAAALRYLRGNLDADPGTARHAMPAAKRRWRAGGGKC